ncbi:hypothetical protein BO86DRAFT_427657, partial [Aspergillus japonicus CBS 114.51]
AGKQQPPYTLSFDCVGGSGDERRHNPAALAATAYARVLLSFVPVSCQKKDLHLSPQDQSAMQHCCVTDMSTEIGSLQRQKDILLYDSYSWVLPTQEFRIFVDWSDSGKSLLWVRGDAGKGKTMLLIGVVHELEAHLELHFDEYCLSYFFCRGTENRLNTATAVLRGLIWMILRQKKSLILHLTKAFTDLGPVLFEDHTAFYNLKRVFSNMLEDQGLGRIYLVVDGLDECRREEPGLSQLLELVAETSTNRRVKWLLSSRNESSIDEALGTHAENGQLCLELIAASVSGAVNAYISHKMSELRDQYQHKLRRNGNLSSWKLAGLIQNIEHVLQDRSYGTFLWVALMIKELKTCAPDKALEKVKKAPPGLHDLCTTILHNLTKPDHAEDCGKVLLIMANAYQSLDLTEIVALAQLDELAAHESIVRHCDFLTFREDIQIVSFMQQSAKDFLVQDQGPAVIHEIFPRGHKEGHSMILSASLTVMESLKRDIFDWRHAGYDIDEVVVPHQDPLESLRFSCLYWIDHLCDMKTGPEEGSLLDEGSHFWIDRSLYWLEALSLLRSYSVAVLSTANVIEMLRRISPKPIFICLVGDFYRFTLANRTAIEKFPLQTYVATLIFAPEQSAIRRLFKHEEPR